MRNRRIQCVLALQSLLFALLSGCGSGTGKDYDWFLRRVSFSPDGSQIAASGWVETSGTEDEGPEVNGHLVTMDVATGTVLHSQSIGNGCWDLDYSRDGRFIATGDDDMWVRVFDAPTCDYLRSLGTHQEIMYSVAFSPDGARAVGGTKSSFIRVWDTQSGALIYSLSGHTGAVNALAYSPDGTMIASSGSTDHTVRIWNASTGTLLRSISTTFPTNRLVFLPTGSTLVGATGTVLVLWDAQTGQQISSISGHTQIVDLVDIASDGKTAVTTSPQDSIPVRIWDLNAGAQIGTLPTAGQRPTAAAISPDGTKVAVVGGNPRVRLYDVASQTIVWSRDGGLTRMATVPVVRGNAFAHSK